MRRRLSMFAVLLLLPLPGCAKREEPPQPAKQVPAAEPAPAPAPPHQPGPGDEVCGADEQLTKDKAARDAELQKREDVQARIRAVNDRVRTLVLAAVREGRTADLAGQLAQPFTEIDAARASCAAPEIGKTTAAALTGVAETGVRCHAVAASDVAVCDRLAAGPGDRRRVLDCRVTYALLKGLAGMIKGGTCDAAPAKQAAEMAEQPGQAPTFERICRAATGHDAAACKGASGELAGLCLALAASNASSCDRAGKQAAACRLNVALLGAAAGMAIDKLPPDAIPPEERLMVEAAQNGDAAACATWAGGQVDKILATTLLAAPPAEAGSAGPPGH